MSAYCQVGTEDLMKRILRFSRTRLFLDVANATITSIREELKTNWIEHFSDPSAFRSGEAALNRLLASAEFERHRQTVDKALSPAEIGARFHRHLEKMTGGRDAIQFGEGNWLDMIRGKPVLAQLVNSNCFRVEAADGTLLRGAEKTNEVVKDLLKQDIARQPKDFRQLKDLVSDRIGS